MCVCVCVFCRHWWGSFTPSVKVTGGSPTTTGDTDSMWARRCSPCWWSDSHTHTHTDRLTHFHYSLSIIFFFCLNTHQSSPSALSLFFLLFCPLLSSFSSSLHIFHLSPPLSLLVLTTGVYCVCYHACWCVHIHVCVQMGKIMTLVYKRKVGHCCLNWSLIRKPVNVMINILTAVTGKPCPVCVCVCVCVRVCACK